MTTIYNVANDLGYSSMKISINDKVEVIPSVIGIQRKQNISKPVTFDSERAKKDYLAELAKNMDVTITSPSIKLNGRFLVGESALTAGIPIRSFDVNDFDGKSESDLALILNLTRIAAQVISDAAENDDSLTDIIKANVNLATALPITEGKRDGVLEDYEQRYLKGKHLISFMNFEQPITVELTFKKVYVGLEGEIAQLKIVNADKELAKEIKRDFDNTYPTVKDQITAEDLTQSQNVLGIDIGEHTTDFSVIIDGHSNANASTSLEVGYGNVLEEAVELLQGDKINITNRSELTLFMSKQVSPLARKRQDYVKQVVFDQLDPFIDQIISSTSETMRRAGSNIELVYVYGGGSIPLQETNMRERLATKLNSFSGEFDIPIVWISADRARVLNREGLQLVVKNQFKTSNS